MPAIYVQNTDALPERAPLDFYPTPIELCRAVVRDLVPFDAGDRFTVLDPGAGTGVWGEAIKEAFPGVTLVGVEINEAVAPNPVYDGWLRRDFLNDAFGEPSNRFAFNLVNRFAFNLVIGNPPYKLAEEFVRRGLEFVAPGGHLIYLLRTEFQNGIKRARGLFTEYPPFSIHPVSPRPSFIPTTPEGKKGGTAPMDYSIFVWRNLDMYIPKKLLTTTWSVLDWKGAKL